MNTGLVSFFFKNDGLDSEKFKFYSEKIYFPIFVFDIIRDVYHEHVHHARNDDCKLKPVSAKNEKEALYKILLQYQAKIFYYHSDLQPVKNILSIPHTKYFEQRKRIALLETALGELIYAKSFIALHKAELETSEFKTHIIEDSFDRAYESISILREKLTWQTMYVISMASIIIAILAAIASIVPIFNFIKKIFKWICL